MKTVKFETKIENVIIKIPKNITKDVDNKQAKILFSAGVKFLPSWIQLGSFI